MDLRDLNKVWEVRPLRRPGEDEARRTLEAVADQVQPLMRKRQWKVRLLSEFCPENPSLMGLNEGGGAHVKLRLRRPDRGREFLPFERVLDTMLHELCHIERGPHDTEFYRLWDEVREECEDLVAKGIKGAAKGFDLPGGALGVHSVPVAAAPPECGEGRRREARAGGRPGASRAAAGGRDGDIKAALTPVQAAAMAAERRMRDDLWCGSRASGVGESSRTADGLVGDASGSLKGGLTSTLASDELSWECSACTLLNQQLSLICEACGTVRPKEAVDKFKTWSCKFCTLDNSINLDKCAACEQWRYSYGPPVSSRGLKLGT